MVFRTDDPHADFDRYDHKCSEWLKSRHKCSVCDKPIQDDYAYYIHEQWVCDECAEDSRKAVN